MKKGLRPKQIKTCCDAHQRRGRRPDEEGIKTQVESHVLAVNGGGAEDLMKKGLRRSL